MDFYSTFPLRLKFKTKKIKRYGKESSKKSSKKESS